MSWVLEGREGANQPETNQEPTRNQPVANQDLIRNQHRTNQETILEAPEKQIGAFLAQPRSSGPGGCWLDPGWGMDDAQFK